MYGILSRNMTVWLGCGDAGMMRCVLVYLFVRWRRDMSWCGVRICTDMHRCAQQACIHVCSVGVYESSIVWDSLSLSLSLKHRCVGVLAASGKETASSLRQAVRNDLLTRYGQSPYGDSGFQRVWLKQNLKFRAWNSHVHREFVGNVESTNLSRDNLIN